MFGSSWSASVYEWVLFELILKGLNQLLKLVWVYDTCFARVN
jgi:hypothetical protein